MIQLTIKYQIEYEIIPIRSTWYSGMTKHQKNKLSKPTASGSIGFLLRSQSIWREPTTFTVTDKPYQI